MEENNFIQFVCFWQSKMKRFKCLQPVFVTLYPFSVYLKMPNYDTNAIILPPIHKLLMCRWMIKQEKVFLTQWVSTISRFVFFIVVAGESIKYSNFHQIGFASELNHHSPLTPKNDLHSPFNSFWYLKFLFSQLTIKFAKIFLSKSLQLSNLKENS